MHSPQTIRQLREWSTVAQAGLYLAGTAALYLLASHGWASTYYLLSALGVGIGCAAAFLLVHKFRSEWLLCIPVGMLMLGEKLCSKTFHIHSDIHFYQWLSLTAFVEMLGLLWIVKKLTVTPRCIPNP